MSSALQVNFRGVPPSEALVATASAHYREFLRDRPALDECLVVIQSVRVADRSLVHAVVQLTESGSAAGQQTEAKHVDPNIALQRALSAARSCLKTPSHGGHERWIPWSGASPGGRPLPRAH
jgi:hypothetical protein